MKPSIIVAKSGHSITDEYYNMKIDSRFDTYKVKNSGTLSYNLPAETLNGEVKTYTTSYAHGLGYVPLVMPYIKGALYQDDLASGGDWIVNDVSEIDLPKGAYSPPLAGEEAYIRVDGTNVQLFVRRYEYLGTDTDFGARKVSLYYTCFYNRLNEAFNLL